MQTITEYINWRGDLNFEASALNEVDVYILSKLGKPDYSGIISEGFDKVLLKDAVEKYLEEHPNDWQNLGVLASPEIMMTIKDLAETERFSKLALTAFSTRLSSEATEQFSALTVILPDDTVVVTFAGTDDTLVAWKEDFLMAVDNEVTAQKDAAAYLEMVAAEFSGNIIVAGHSKGGNLAVYASAMASMKTQDRITAVYNYDGPGFHRSFTHDPGYLSIKDRIHTILPYHSIVGVLLSRAENCSIVSCKKRGIASHDGFMWELDRTVFKRVEELSRESRAFEEAVAQTLDKMSRTERLAFIEEFFAALDTTGAVTIDDLTEHRISEAFTIIASLKNASEAKAFASKVLKGIIKNWRE